MSERIGVYTCECGPNIRDALDVDAVVRYAGGLEKVVLSRPFGLLCAEEGKALIAGDITTHRLNRVGCCDLLPWRAGSTAVGRQMHF